MVEPAYHYRTYRKHIDAPINDSSDHNVCSFLRLEKALEHIYRGVSIVEAIAGRYQPDDAGKDDMYLESDTGKRKKVEFAGRAEAEEHFKNISKLKFIEVDCTISSCGLFPDLQSFRHWNLECLNIDNSQMLHDWHHILDIVEEFRSLRKLALPRCWRLGMISSTLSHRVCQRHLSLLDLTGIPLTWEFLNDVKKQFPYVDDLVLANTGLGALPAAKTVDLSGVNRLHLDQNSKLFRGDMNKHFFTDVLVDCSSVFLHHTLFMPSDFIDSTPNSMVKELGIDQIKISSWGEFFYLSKLFPSLERLSMAGSALEKADAADLNDECIWDMKFHWRIPRGHIMSMMACLMFPCLESYNFRRIDCVLRSESHKYLMSLMRRDHPLVQIMRSHDIFQGSISEIAESGLGTFDDDIDRQRTEVSNINVLIEPDIHWIDQWPGGLSNPTKLMVPAEISMGQLLELYMRKQSIDVRARVKNLTLYNSVNCGDADALVNLEGGASLYDWLVSQGVDVASDQAIKIAVAPLNEKEEIPLVSDAAGIRSRPLTQ
eukprot:GHVH01000185.1.p1 GENE.GHVH01000185.1~~GHVH01000185.1.p1  ORF type:complete len:543 (+),score=78.87 GHVH01000185.1:380-2008(+)